MTEEEAKTKWCPFARVSDMSGAKAQDDGPPHNRYWNEDASHPADEIGLSPASFCIGSACMAWRSRPQWRQRSDMPWQDGENPKRGPNNEGRAAGFCGLAGAP